MLVKLLMLKLALDSVLLRLIFVMALVSWIVVVVIDEVATCVVLKGWVVV